MEISTIKKMIEDGLECTYVQVDGDGSHFFAKVVSHAFDGLSVIKQHKKVYATLGDKVGGEIHAFSVQTYTPDAWEKAKKLLIT